MENDFFRAGDFRLANFAFFMAQLNLNLFRYAAIDGPIELVFPAPILHLSN